MQGEYLIQAGMERGLRSYLARAVLHYIRLWDLASAGRADFLIANSQHTARRIRKIYHRPAEVIYPPVDVGAFKPEGVKEDFYLTASRLVLHKRVDLIVEAFTHMPDRKLVVIGEGPELKKIAGRAGTNIQFLGYQPFPVFLSYMQRARGFIFAALGTLASPRLKRKPVARRSSLTGRVERWKPSSMERPGCSSMSRPQRAWRRQSVALRTARRDWM
jgi:glycosyltransferase involved in cell wall biosynthesis